MKLSVYNTEGKETSKTVSLSKDIFGIEPNDHAIYLDVKNYLAAQRQGTHKSKERSDVTGSRRKIRKQKGSGAARVGDIKNPLFRGGGRVFGPRPRSYDFKLNKKVKVLARKSALSQIAKDKKMIILEDFSMDTPSTKDFAKILSNLDQTNNKTLLILTDSNKNILLSSRNLKKTKVVNVSSINTYDLMNAHKLMFVESSIKEIEKNYKN
ncbi:MAG: 50S ribosomal protein L4 [Flavobacteriales bacterium]|jgi:large subunit ribosomal protein L4|nr:50S ribosomal protein L4 [Flavobacteriales bacterium]MBT4477806.1 50S ribosomal protein L4 [Flavobacteriales bacterium]MBT4737602.1 50S ribosomal protein L4 [Flavobacteriales bacterium]MBT6699780.1 50S ribosomal protein L4 [Flavobacteriales bacterium]MBT6815505.1 50S ribosomal protein L4 [Flavobacteriales bacterium]|tara:strand:- start:146 stop:775 length:630 start_codon:yes stop_codon:yes gene_type:complete